MTAANPPVPSPRQWVRILHVHAKRWLFPVMVLGMLAAGYAVLRPETWEASQALIVRDEAANNELGPGKFSHSDEMKTVQETILELAKSRGVLDAALRKVGPPSQPAPRGAWPKAEDVEALRGSVKLVPPKGAEFGKTEVFYLKVRSRGRARAMALSRAICDQLEGRFKQLRDAKAQSMIGELVKTVRLARDDLAQSTTRLTRLEKQVASDLPELRSMSEPGSGDSALRRTITEIRGELRQVQAAAKANEKLLELLGEARHDPGRLLATPSTLLESQPALRRLKDGLIDAQLATASLKGIRSGDHPLVRSAKESEEEVGRHLHDELAIAIHGLEVEARLHADREKILRDELDQATERLGRLAELRAAYANLVAETEHRSELVKRAEQNLAEARAAHAGANAASLISRIGTPDPGAGPLGPGRATILLVGIVGGLLTGFGVLFLTVDLQAPILPEPEAAARPAASDATRPATTKPPRISEHPRSGLSLKEALQKIAYGSKA